MTASDSRAALDLIDRYGANIDLLLTDVVLPQMSGRELAQVFAQRLPAARIIYMSGYANDTWVQEQVRTGKNNLIAKPLSINELARLVRSVLTERENDTNMADAERFNPG